MADALHPGELSFHDVMPHCMQVQESLCDLERGLRYDRLNRNLSLTCRRWN